MTGPSMPQEQSTLPVERYIAALQQRLVDIGLPHGHRSIAHLEQALHLAYRHQGVLEARNQVVRQLNDMAVRRTPEGVAAVISFPNFTLVPLDELEITPAAPDPKESPPVKALKNSILALLLLAIGGAAFRLSFDAQVTLAIASGVNADLAGLYPLVVDAAILMAVLIGIWSPDLRKALSRYLWGAIAFWTATSVLGNAIHVIALPAGHVTVDQLLAIAVNTIPALTLFLVIHIATTIAFRPAERTTAPPVGRVVAIRGPQGRTDVPPATDADILAMSDEGLSLQAIADRIGRSKSYAGNRLRDAKAALAESNREAR